MQEGREKEDKTISSEEERKESRTRGNVDFAIQYVIYIPINLYTLWNNLSMNIYGPLLRGVHYQTHR